MTTVTTAGPTLALLEDINAAFNSRDVDRIMGFFAEDCTFRGDKICKDTHWMLVEKADRL